MFKRIKISEIKGAEYNPRFLSEDAKINLLKSFEIFGQVKPIIVRKENLTIVAGHQRTKILKLLGHDEVDVIFINGVTKQDEVRFNQLHNKCEVEVNTLQPIVKIPMQEKTGYFIVKNSDIKIERKNSLGLILDELTRLINRYGNFGSAICTKSGEVIVSALYANAVKLLGLDLLIYVLPDEKKEICINTFKKDYGVFNYDHLEKNTFVQTWAQMKRLKGVGQLKSRLYENIIIPFLKDKKELRILDFGSGEGAYYNKLKNQGYNIFELEFYRKANGKNSIDVNAVNKMFKILEDDILKNGLFDVIICDSVLNSVDSLEAEKSVLITLNAFCKKEGTIFWSGRPKDKRELLKTTAGNTATLYFSDENLFTANYKQGYWFYQKFHTDKMIEDLNKKHISNDFKLSKNSTSFQVKTTKQKTIAESVIIDALKFEFSLPLPNGSYKLWDENIDFFNKIVEWNK